MIDPVQLRSQVIRPVLQGLDLWTPAAEQLVLLTAAQESRLTYIKQLGTGPALGLWQIEPATHADLWTNWLQHRPLLANRVLAITRVRTPDASSWQVDPVNLQWSLAYGAAICRLIYRRRPEPMPAHGDLPGMAAYWKKWFNTPKGAGTVTQFLARAGQLPAEAMQA